MPVILLLLRLRLKASLGYMGAPSLTSKQKQDKKI